VRRPPNRKLLLAIAVLVVAASNVLARSADHAKGETQTMNSIVLGGR
jgi:hypothetical protein